MADKKLDIYVGCSLTQAPQEFVDSVESLKDTLKQSYDVFDFLGLVDGTERDVYDWDIKHCVGQAALLLAVCDYPSIGLGYEMATAIEKQGTPTLAVAHEDTKVTRLILGVDAPNYRFRRYQSLDQVAEFVDEEIERHGLVVAETVIPTDLSTFQQPA